MNESDILKSGKEVLEIEKAAIEKAAESLDSSFVEVAGKIAGAKKLITTGVGKSGLIGRKIAATFASIGIPSYFMHSVDALHGDLGIVEKGDVCILLSKSGTTKEIIEILPYLKNRGATIVSISSNPDSFLAVNSDYWLNSYVEKEGCPIDTAPMASALVSLALGDALAASVMRIKSVSLKDFSKQHPMGQIGRNLTLSVNDVMHKDKNLPYVNSLSRFKDALIEITKKNLGCVCIVDEMNILKGIITDGDIRRVLIEHQEIKDIRVTEVMTKNPISIMPGKLLGEALALMEHRESQINVLPVVNKDNELIGVIRLHDIVKSGL